MTDRCFFQALQTADANAVINVLNDLFATVVSRDSSAERRKIHVNDSGRDFEKCFCSPMLYTFLIIPGLRMTLVFQGFRERADPAPEYSSSI